MDKLQQLEKIYKEIAEEDKNLSEDFLSVSLENFERMEKEFKGAKN